MPREKEELCAIVVFRAVWRMLQNAKNLEDAKKSFKELLLTLILEE